MTEYNDMYEEFESNYPYDDEIETTMLAWERLAESYCEKARIISTDLYQQLSKIKCKKTLTNQITRIGKPSFISDSLSRFQRKISKI